MEALLFSPYEAPNHKCRPLPQTSSQILFCRECDVFLGTSSVNSNTNSLEPAREGSEHEKSVYYRVSKHDGGFRVNVDHEKNLENMLRKQHMNRFYNEDASHLIVRPKIVDFMKKIHERFEKGPEILHKALVFMDSVFSRIQVSFEKIEIIVLVCLHIASKFDEPFSNYDPDKSFFKYAQKSYSFRDIISLEKQLVKILDFQLDVQSPFHFLNFFNSRGVVTQRDIMDLMRVYSQTMEGSFPGQNHVSVKESSEMQFLKKNLKMRIEHVRFELDGGKKNGINIDFSDQNILDFLGLFSEEELFRKPKMDEVILEIKETQINEKKENIFDKLEKCYSNNLWPIFIEFIFQKNKTCSQNFTQDQMKMADKNYFFNKSNLKKVCSKLSEFLKSKKAKKPIHSNKIKVNVKTEIEVESDPKKPSIQNLPKLTLPGFSFLSSNSYERLNRTSIFQDQGLTSPSPSLNINDIQEETLEKVPTRKMHVSLSDFDLSNFKFTISTNIMTTSRLLNCLRFNKESLPVGLVEVCCSNFENIFQIILQASTEVYSLNKFTSIAVAVSILYISRKLMNFSQVWTKDLTLLTGLSEADIEGCVSHVLEDKSMYRLVSEMKKSFEFEEQQAVFGSRKIISFKSILHMYRYKAQKLVDDFNNFEKTIKNQLLMRYMVEEIKEEELETQIFLDLSNSKEAIKTRDLTKMDTLASPGILKSEFSCFQFNQDKENIPV